LGQAYAASFDASLAVTTDTMESILSTILFLSGRQTRLAICG